jgi:hypothetical protein
MGQIRFCVAFVLVIGATAALAQQQQQQQQDETFTIHYDAGSRDQVSDHGGILVMQLAGMLW